MFKWFKFREPTRDEALAQELREAVKAFNKAKNKCRSAGLSVSIYYGGNYHFGSYDLEAKHITRDCSVRL